MHLHQIFVFQYKLLKLNSTIYRLKQKSTAYRRPLSQFNFYMTATISTPIETCMLYNLFSGLPFELCWGQPAYPSSSSQVNPPSLRKFSCQPAKSTAFFFRIQIQVLHVNINTCLTMNFAWQVTLRLCAVKRSSLFLYEN